MDKLENRYCRLCAEPKSSNKLLDLETEEKKREEIYQKLTFLNAIYVVTDNDNILPKTVCFVCYDSLNQACEFLNKVKKAQHLLSNLFSTNGDEKYDLFDDERIGFDDFLATDAADDNVQEIKEEKPSPDKRKNLDTNKTNTNDSTIVEVKKEPKEEVTDTTKLLEVAIESIQDSPSTDTYEQNLNVQDIIDAAMCTGPYKSNITIYAKELSDISKKDVTSWKDYPWICAYCNIEFLDMVTLRSHSKVVHRKCSAFVCIDCKTFGKNDNFELFVSHVRKHRKSLRNYCHYCDAPLAKENITTHMKQHFQKSQTSCPSCGEILKNDSTLQEHLLEYNTSKPKRKPRRKRGTPITIEELTCKLCQKVYKNPNSLRDHMKLHTSDRKRNYTCDRCGKTFFNKGTLTSHIMSHDKIRPHVCRICNKSFLFPNMLRRHVEMHSGVKPFSCEQCGRCFRLQYQLNAHKIIHTDSMPYVCQYCSKAFRFKQILKNHERQHTGAKPYSCQQCGMEFTNWSNYNKHMKRRHGTDTSKKKITPEGVFPINPETGQIIRVQDPVGTEEWKNKIMIPGKRGKKKVIKQEDGS